jgi:predicted DNA-binding protein
MSIPLPVDVPRHRQEAAQAKRIQGGRFGRGSCRLEIYMTSTDTTTIRVPTETRDRLNGLAARWGEPAGEIVSRLVSAADEETMLAEVAAGFERLAGDPRAFAAYRAESEELESGFEAPAPKW